MKNVCLCECVTLLVCRAVALVFCGGCFPAPVSPLDSGHQELKREVHEAFRYKDKIYSLPLSHTHAHKIYCKYTHTHVFKGRKET